MSGNRTEEIKRTSYKEGRDSKLGGLPPGRSQDPRYDDDEGGATGWDDGDFDHTRLEPKGKCTKVGY